MKGKLEGEDRVGITMARSEALVLYEYLELREHPAEASSQRAGCAPCSVPSADPWVAAVVRPRCPRGTTIRAETTASGRTRVRVSSFRSDPPRGLPPAASSTWRIPESRKLPGHLWPGSFRVEAAGVEPAAEHPPRIAIRQ